ncbi:Alsin [Toxocara canis]|uniref:Alsin n=1 Tax=Toxocara canis TaxID=6265 RepID=A0A0B2VPE1_TOXCA|nr:Alsin [Toxocara canis]
MGLEWTTFVSFLMRLIWTSTGQRKELASNETSWSRLVDDITTTLNSFVYFNGTRFCLVDGKIFRILPNGSTAPFLSVDSPLLSSRFSYINASGGTFFAVSEEGRLYARGKSNYGQCGVVLEDEIAEFREVKLIAPLAVCPHGTTVTSHEPICVCQVAASQNLVCIVDDEGHLWSYGGQSLKFSSNGCIEAKLMPLSRGRKVLQIEAGMAHFVSLVASYAEEDGKGVELDTQSLHRSILPSRQCEQCREEDELRLSTLMERADRDAAQERCGLEDLVKCDEEASENLISAARNLRLQFRTDSSQSSPRAKTLPLQNDFHSSRKSRTVRRENTEGGEIEMSTIGPPIGLELMNLPGGHFTFVSLNNLPLTYMDSGNESCSNTDCTTSTCSSSRRSAASSPRKNGTSDVMGGRDDKRAPLEVWTWGANNFGQLGHNDLIARREPFRVSALSGICCVKVSAGDNHTAVLTATGEMYVWGSNKCGQLKQSDQSYLTAPSLFRDAAQERCGLEDLVKCDEEASENLISAARNLRLQFRTDSSQSSPRAKTLPLQNDFHSSRKSRTVRRENTEGGEIEMSTIGPPIGLELMNLPGGHFTFVSLNNLPLTYMDSGNESCSNTDCTTSTCSSSRRSAASSPRKNGTSDVMGGRDDKRAPLEVWTWGANNFGQLGHNDLIARREPFRVSALSGICCVKVSAGDNHTAVLTATGEMYVWGSNKCGQLKQSDQSYLTAPSLFRVGSQSSVLDVSASVSQTAVIVSGIDATPTVYLCGQNAQTSFLHPQTFRISSVEKIGLPSCVRLLGSELVLGMYGRDDLLDETGVALFSFVFSRLKFAKFARELADLCQMLHERSHIVGESEMSTLLNRLTLSSCAFAVQAARLAESCRTVLTQKGDASICSILEAAMSLPFMDSLYTFHADFVDCIAFGCFADIDLG